MKVEAVRLRFEMFIQLICLTDFHVCRFSNQFVVRLNVSQFGKAFVQKQVPIPGIIPKSNQKPSTFQISIMFP